MRSAGYPAFVLKHEVVDTDCLLGWNIMVGSAFLRTVLSLVCMNHGVLSFLLLLYLYCLLDVLEGLQATLKEVLIGVTWRGRYR